MVVSGLTIGSHSLLSSDRNFHQMQQVTRQVVAAESGNTELLGPMVVNSKPRRGAGSGFFGLRRRNHAGNRSRTGRFRIAAIAFAGALMLAGTSDWMLSQAWGDVATAERCLAANEALSLGAVLPRTAARLKSG